MKSTSAKLIHAREVTNRFLQVYQEHVGVKSSGKGTQIQFCEKIGITPGNLIRLVKDEAKNITLQQLCNLIIFYNVEPGWVLTGIGAKYQNHEKQTPPVIKKQLMELHKSVENALKYL